MTAVTSVASPDEGRTEPADAGSQAQGPPPSAKPRVGPVFTRLWHPLTAICALQAGLSLSLVWSNTALGDEAWDLWLGRLAIRHWLHGSPWPSQEERISGSAFISPPLAAIASAAGGL